MANQRPVLRLIATLRSSLAASPHTSPPELLHLAAPSAVNASSSSNGLLAEKLGLLHCTGGPAARLPIGGPMPAAAMGALAWGGAHARGISSTTCLTASASSNRDAVRPSADEVSMAKDRVRARISGRNR